MKIHLVASMPQYERHVRAVWRHLADDVKGLCVTGRGASARRLPAGEPVMVGSFYDIPREGHPVVYVEHGAGQTYDGDPAKPNRYATNYAGGEHPSTVVGYICPSWRVADRWDRPSFIAGCPAVEDLPAGRRAGQVAAITFHFEARQVAPEARTARPHYENDLGLIVTWLREHDYDVIGSAHPKDLLARGIWRNLGVEFEPDPDVVLRKASLLIADNTSLMYEAALLDIPVMVLNCPWYRKDIHHGLRFWEAVPGRQYEDAWDLVAENPLGYIQNLVADPSRQLTGHPVVWEDRTRELRTAAAEYAYGGRPVAKAGWHAARWITDLVLG